MTTVHGIAVRRDQAIREAKAEAERRYTSIVADMQAKIDAAEREYTREMNLHLARATAPRMAA